MDTLDHIRADLAALIAAAGPRRAPTFEQARAWLWCADTARGRRDAALAAGDLDLAAAYRKLGDRLETTAQLDRDALAAGARDARDARNAALGIGR